MKRVDHWYRWVENALASIAGVSLLVMVAIMVADALGRYVFNTGLQGTYRLVELFLFPALLFLAWPFAQRAGRNVAVDLFRRRASGWVLRLLDTAVALLVLGLIVLVAYGAYQGMLSEWGKWTVEMPSLPMGPSRLILFIGAGALVLRLVLQVVGSAMGRGHEVGEPNHGDEAELLIAASESDTEGRSVSDVDKEGRR